jgi:alkyldihydroxyacetonephosphate synthase
MHSPFHPSSPLGNELLGVLPATRISQSAADRLVYSRDMWPKALLSVRDNKPQVMPPEVVVWPETTEEVAAILALASRLGVPVVPYGGGSGVCGGAMAVRGGIVLDLKRMARLVSLSTTDHLATFETGIVGQTLEDQLNLRGLTLGHFPASIYCSTLGGWLAARSAGQLSSRYGKIEDMVVGLRVVLGDGRILDLSAGHEPNLVPIFVGSEGTLCVITEATLRVCPLPSVRLFRGYEFPNVAAGCEAMRRVMQRGQRPAVLRLYDEMDTLLARRGHSATGEEHGKAAGRSLLSGALELLPKHAAEHGEKLRGALVRAALSRAGLLGKIVEAVVPKLSGGCLLVAGYEGEPALTEAEASVCHAELTAAGGKDLGEGPGLSWYQNRYAVSYKMSPLYTDGGFVDTLEVASTWDRLLALYDDVRRSIASHAMVLAHFSHAYPEGCSIYFTFAASAEGRTRSDHLYDEIWRRGLTAVVRAGGTISHHHGVGLSKSAFMHEEHGAALGLFRQLKSIVDPRGILNPDKMGL